MDKRRMNHLLVEISRGNNDAFEKLYKETSKGIYALLYPYFLNSDDTEDALEEVYILVKKKAYTYKSGTDARAWLFQVAKNYALNEIRKQKRQAEGLARLQQEYDAPRESKWDSTLFLIMQHTLTEEEYQIVIRHILMSYKHKEIAVELGLPLGTVLSKYQIALKKLREELEHEKN